MYRQLLRAICTLAMALMLAPVFVTGALAMSEAQSLSAGALAEFDLDQGDVAYTFTPTANSVYDIYLFPMGEENPVARTELWQGDQRVASGEENLPAISVRLTAGVEYTVRIAGQGRGMLEVARHALSRCFAQPMALDAEADEYSKAIARQGDVHWYSLDAASDLPVVLVGVPADEGLQLEARLFNADGKLLAEATRTSGGAFLMDFEPREGGRYYLRVSSPNADTGMYGLAVRRSAIRELPEKLSLSQTEITLEGRSSQTLTAGISPAGACELLFWESSDPTVVAVNQSGALTGRRPGTAVVTAYAAGSVFARCRVEVKYVAATGINMITDTFNMNVGDDTALECFIEPENASERRMEFEVSPEGIVEITKNGVMRAVGEGTATITVKTHNGQFQDSAQVIVGPPVKRYRALLVGEQNYASTVAAVRPGSANSVTNIRSMLGELSYDGAKFQTNTLMDVSRDGVVAGIRSAFEGATEQDLSLFYITCHGYYDDGVTYLQMYDGSVFTAVELERELRKIPGTIVVMIDCCGSGGVIGKASGTEDILDGVLSVFQGNVGAPAISGSKYKVLASAALQQDSYGISFNESAVESDMATVFARALCEAAGWSIDRAGRNALRADINYDSSLTLNELFNYTSRRVNWYLEMTSSLSGDTYVQNVQVYPKGDTSEIFRRTS